MEYELPKTWIETTVGECFHEIVNGTTANQNKVGIGVPVSRIETIQGSRFDLNRIQHIDEVALTDELFHKYRYQSGDIAFSHINSMEHVGKVALYEGSPKIFIHGMNLLRLRLGHKHINPRYVYYQMLSTSFREEVRSRVGQAVNQVSINQKNLSEVPLVIAPLVEQQRIVAKLDKILARVNNCKTRLDKIPTLVKNFRQSVLAAAVRGELTKEWREKNKNIPSAFELLKSIQKHRINKYEEELGKWKKGKSAKPRTPIHLSYAPRIATSDDYPGTWAQTRIADVSDCLDYIRKPINKDERFKRQGDIPYYGANGQVGWIDDYLFDEDLVVIVEDETFLGREIPFSYIIRGKSWVNNHAHVLRPVGGISVEYLNITFSYYNFTPLTSGTTGRRKLTQGALMNAEFALAPLEEQKEIVRKVEELFHFADSIEARYQKAKARFGKLPQSILSKAFRGQLVPQNETDEPASVLLQRIKKEKQQTTKPKTKTTTKTKKLYQENDIVSMVAEG